MHTIKQKVSPVTHQPHQQTSHHKEAKNITKYDKCMILQSDVVNLLPPPPALDNKLLCLFGFCYQFYSAVINYKRSQQAFSYAKYHLWLLHSGNVQPLCQRSVSA